MRERASEWVYEEVYDEVPYPSARVERMLCVQGCPDDQFVIFSYFICFLLTTVSALHFTSPFPSPPLFIPPPISQFRLFSLPHGDVAPLLLLPLLHKLPLRHLASLPETGELTDWYD